MLEVSSTASSAVQLRISRSRSLVCILVVEEISYWYYDTFVVFIVVAVIVVCAQKLKGNLSHIYTQKLM